jgi:coatomer protein complex subunit alpha (xenin)
MTVVPGEAVFYIKDRYIRAYEFATGRDVPVLTLRKRDAAPRNIQYNKAEQSLIVNFVESDNQGFYELYSLPKTRNGTAVESQTDNNKRGSGKSAVWFSRNKFAVLDKHGSVHLRDGQGSDVKLETSYAVDAIFTAPSGQLLLKVDDRAILYDVARKTEVAETCIPSGVKFVEWSGYDTNSFISFISKDTVVITNAKLEVLSTIAERTRIKSGVWDDSGIFIYCTMGHIKYSLPGGDHGIVRTLDQPIYLTAVKGNKIYCLDRECRNRGVTIDTTEYMFKQALVQKRFGEVLKMVRGANLVGQSIIGYLQQKGFPEVALHFVKDERTRFELALECGNIDIARESAEILGDSDAFRKLGHEALRQGHQEVRILLSHY